MLNKSFEEKIIKNETSNSSFSSNNSINETHSNNSFLEEVEYSIGPFQILHEIGEGSFSTVYLGYHKSTNQKVCIKQIKKSNIKDINIINNEINNHKKLLHSNIIKIFCIIETDNFIFIVEEYCSKGNLLEKILNEGKLSESNACKIFQQILFGLEYLHEYNICHRDLKPENILIDNNNIIKISDFSLSKHYQNSNTLLSTPCGSPLYTAPEVIKNEKYNGEKIDVYSLGVILYIITCGMFPFVDENIKKLIFKITKGQFTIPNFLSFSCKNLIKNLMNLDPEKRYDLKEIKNDSWVKALNNVLIKKNNLLFGNGINIYKNIIPIDIKIVIEIYNKFNYNIEDILKNLLKNKHNKTTVYYYCKVQEMIENNIETVSNYNSKLFNEYIKNEKNILHNENEIEERIILLKNEIENVLNNNKNIYNFISIELLDEILLKVIKLIENNNKNTQKNNKSYFHKILENVEENNDDLINKTQTNFSFSIEKFQDLFINLNIKENQKKIDNNILSINKVGNLLISSTKNILFNKKSIKNKFLNKSNSNNISNDLENYQMKNNKKIKNCNIKLKKIDYKKNLSLNKTNNNKSINKLNSNINNIKTEKNKNNSQNLNHLSKNKNLTNIDSKQTILNIKLTKKNYKNNINNQSKNIKLLNSKTNENLSNSMKKTNLKNKKYSLIKHSEIDINKIKEKKIINTSILNILTDETNKINEKKQKI